MYVREDGHIQVVSMTVADMERVDFVLLLKWSRLLTNHCPQSAYSYKLHYMQFPFYYVEYIENEYGCWVFDL